MLAEPGLELGEAFSGVGKALIVLLTTGGEQGGIKGQFGEVNTEDVHGQPPSCVGSRDSVFRATLVRASWQNAGSGSSTASENTRDDAADRSVIRSRGHRTFTALCHANADMIARFNAKGTFVA